MLDLKSLKQEWLALCAARKMDAYLEVQTREGKQGTIVRVCGPHGCHESYDGVEAAMELLVDSFRTRVEDLETTHRAILKWRGGDLKDARQFAAQCAAEVRGKNPGLPGEKRDALVLEALGAEEKALLAARSADLDAARAAAKHPGKVPPK